jgi:ABC-type Fe3+-hydroxamate transport system substrate-binding protein
MRKLVKILPLVLVLFLLTGLLAACQPAATTAASTTAATTAASDATTTPEETTAAPIETTAATEATTSATVEETTTTGTAGFPVTVKNAAGEDVVIDSKPMSIIITNVWAGEILLDMVPADRIKGLSAWSDDAVLSATAGKAAAVAARVSTYEPEGIVALTPDLVVIDTFSDADGSLTKTLTDAGATVLQLASPTDFDQIKAAVTTLAAAVGEVETGSQMVADIDAELAAVATKLSGLKDEDKMTVMFYDTHYGADGKDDGMLAAYGQTSPFNAIAKAAGLVNVCDMENYAPVSKEKVVGEWQPELLVVPGITYGADFSVIDDQGASFITAIKADALLATVPAVANDRLVALTAAYGGSTSHYMVLAVAELAAFAYPDLMK